MSDSAAPMGDTFDGYAGQMGRLACEILLAAMGGLVIFLTGILANLTVNWAFGAEKSLPLVPREQIHAATALAFIFLQFLLFMNERSSVFVGTPRNTERSSPTSFVFVFVFAFYLLLGHVSLGGLARLALWYAAAVVGVERSLHLVRATLEHSNLQHWLAQPAVLVGTGPGALRLARSGRSPTGEKVHILGFFDDRRRGHEGLPPDLPYLGPLDALADFAADHEDLCVYLAMPWTAGARILTLAERLQFLPITLRLLPDPDLAGPMASQMMPGTAFVMPLLAVPPLSAWDRAVKGAFDFLAGSLILLMLLPVLAAIALWIHFDSPGPILFRQKRIGQFGRHFRIYKFRTLYKPDWGAATMVTAKDPRVTRAGRFLRRYSLDELPQIFNVLRGEMSLVGPRPHALQAKADGKLYADAIPNYPLRYRVRPGMTGWAQVNGWRGPTDTVEQLAKRVEFDFYYIWHWSFWLDLKILFMTVRPMLFPKDNL